MVAWCLRGIAVFNVLFLSAWCVWSWPHSPWLTGLGVLLFLLSGRIWLGLQFWMMWAYKRKQGLPAPVDVQLIGAWNSESKESARQFAWLMPWCEWAEPDYLPADAQGRQGVQGVVLVHGFMCNRAMWTDAMRELRARNIPFVAVSLPLLINNVEDARATVDSAVRRVHAATGMAPLMMSHSMGGLVARDWLRGLPAEQLGADWVPETVITIGSPHHGTPLAHWMWGRNVEQMRPGNAWLAELARDEAQPGSAFSRVRWHCVYSDCDNVVFPESTSQLEPAERLWLRGYAHVQMLQAPELWALVHASLRRTFNG